MSRKYAVLGAGNAGFAFAGHLGLKGYEVTLYESLQFAKNLDAVKRNGGITLKDNLTGFGKVAKCTTDMREAVEDADTVIVAVPEFAQRTLMEEYIKYAREGQTVAFFPGNYASFKFKKLVEDSGKKLTLAEAASIPYGARKRDDESCNIIGWKYQLHMAALPSSETPRVLQEFNEFNDVFIDGGNVLAVGLANPNFVVHCTSMALNAGWVESTKGDFSLYWQGMSPSVCNVILAVDAERVAVAKALGYDIITDKQFFENYYRLKGDTLYDVIQTSENHGCSGAPSSLKDRYITEDAPAGLTACVSLGKKLGIPTPACQAVLTICSLLNQADYYTQGLNTKNLGIDDMSIDEIREYVK